MGLDQDLYVLPADTSLEDSEKAFYKRLEVRQSVIYWRKNYSIDNWFGDNVVEEGKDWDDPHLVSFGKLMELKTACQVIIANLNNIKRVMPSFLDWAMDSDEFVKLKKDLQRTEEVLSGLEDNPDVIYVYQRC